MTVLLRWTLVLALLLLLLVRSWGLRLLLLMVRWLLVVTVARRSLATVSSSSVVVVLRGLTVLNPVARLAALVAAVRGRWRTGTWLLLLLRWLRARQRRLWLMHWRLVLVVLLRRRSVHCSRLDVLLMLLWLVVGVVVTTRLTVARRHRWWHLVLRLWHLILWLILSLWSVILSLCWCW